jgi:hypothetical protein
MNRGGLLAVVLTTTLLCCPIVLAQTSTPAGAGRRALLVGCTSYENLSQSRWLRGPNNDVVLMRSLLMEEFGFPGEAILTLAEGPEFDRPTRANIERELKHLAKVAGPDDQVVIFLSGHGSQQPDRAPLDEDDGLDETFLPADIGDWDGTKMTVENAIIDDELRTWLDAICRKGARVWLIADACSSGTLIRGRGHAVPRWIAPSELIPKQVLDKCADRYAKPRAGLTEDLEQLAGLVALSAAPPGETAFEDRLLESGNRHCGRLTFTLVEVLKGPHPPLSYWELSRRICLKYDARQWDLPAPMLEGRHEDRERLVLGAKDNNTCRFELTRDRDGQIKLKAGALHGLTEGTILAVKGRADGDVAGHVRIVAGGLGSLESQVKPCTAEGSDAPIDLKVPAFCRVAILEYGELRVKVAVDREDGELESGKMAEPKKLAAAELGRLGVALREAADGHGHGEPTVMPVDNPDAADWLIRATSPAADRVELVPVNGWARGNRPPEMLGPFDPRPSEIAERIARIARVRNLLKIAADPTAFSSPSGPNCQLTVDVLRIKDAQDHVGQSVETDAQASFRVGDIVGLRITNQGATPVDVTLLWIDGNYGISAVFPRPNGLGQDNRIQPGERLLRRFVIVEKGIGREHVVVIAVAPRQLEDRADFSFLADRALAEAQRGLEDRGGSRASPTTIASPLGRLMQNAMLAQGQSRGLKATESQDCSICVRSWNSRPKISGAVSH